MPISIKEYLGELSKEDPNKIISEIKAELDSLVNEMLNNASKELYIVGRKSRHLFLPLVNSRLLEKGFSIHFLNVMTGKIRGEIVCVVDHPYKLPREISLLADSIDDGEEKAAIVSIMQKNGTRIKNIFCYLANEDGLAFLKSKKVLAPENIFSLHRLSSEEYRQFDKRLETYYQSRIEPMDTDHEFSLFSAAKKISPKNLFSVFEASVKKALDCKKGEFSEATTVNSSNKDKNILFVPENIVNFNFECYDFNSCEKGICQNLPNLNVEYLQIRLKADLRETEATISLMVFCPPVDLAFQSIFKNGKCRFKADFCPLEGAKYDKSEFTKEEIALIVCPQCIENQVSHPILERVTMELGTLLGVGG